MSSAEGESRAWQCLGQHWLLQVLPPLSAVAFFPVSVPETEASLLSLPSLYLRLHLPQQLAFEWAWV